MIQLQQAMALSAALLPLLLLFVVLSVTQAADEASRILSLPGFDGNLASRHYSGYITVDESHGRALFYYFVASERNLSSDPVILWLNGGPGCSSFDGFIYEHGPFKFFAGGDGPNDLPVLRRNNYTWTKLANFIYLESPAGVGFSYSNNTEDYETGDFRTARDAHTFLLKWFEKYSEYRDHEFYILGQSYGGVYVPDLAQEIANGIDAGVSPVIKFKGYMIGNGWTDRYYDGNALVPFVYGMGLIPVDLFEEVSRSCNSSYWNATDPECLANLDAVSKDIYDLNLYNILEPCYHEPNLWKEGGMHSDLRLRIPDSFRTLGETSDVPIRKRMFGLAWPLRMPIVPGVVPKWRDVDSNHLRCVNTQFAHAWLNNPMVRKALHAMPEELIGRWTVCSDILTFHHESGSKIPTHRDLTMRGYRAHIYSGDHDLCVPYTGTEAWTRSLGYKELRGWHPWYVDGQIAGYSVSYEHGLTFTTVKGCGHTVPEYKPREAIAMLERWLTESPLL